MEFAHKLLTLLNSYTPDLVRTESLGKLSLMNSSKTMSFHLTVLL